MEQKIAGRLIFFKDGKELECPLTYSQRHSTRIKQSILSKEEAKFLGKIEGEPYEEKLYRQLTQKGFSMIRIMPFIKGDKILENEFDVTISLANELSKDDAENMDRAIKSIQSDKRECILEEQIYVYDQVNNGKNTYYYNKKINNQTDGNVSRNEAFECFLRYKTGESTKEDIEMLKEYKEFDLENLFMKDSSTKPITNRGEGVIVITQNGKRFSQTKKKEQHKNEAQEMIGNIFDCNVDDLEIEELSKKYGVIIIRIYKTDRNAIIAYCPQNMSVNQIDEFIKSLKEFEAINQKLSKQGKPKILALLGGNEDIEMDYENNPDLESIAKKVEEYENRIINTSISKKVAHAINLITSDIEGLIKKLGKLRNGLEEPEGR